MKPVVLFLVVLTAAYVSGDCVQFILKHKILSEADRLEIEETCRECTKETNVQEELFDQIINDVYPDNREMKCFFRCAAKRFGALKENGEFDLTRSKKTMLANRFELAKKCSETIHSEDQCELIYEVHKCYVNKMKELNILL